MFRFTAVLQEEVRPDKLQQALEETARRFPYFCVRLRRGMFWYYLEENTTLPKAEGDTRSPCPPLQKGELPFRVRYWENRISCEFAHVICDGTGGIAFFKTLLAQYLRLLGVEIPYGPDLMDISQPPQPGEWEDAFGRFSRMGAKPSRAEPKAYRPTGVRLPAGMRVVTTGVLQVGQVLGKAKEYGVSLTEYLTAVLAYVLYREQEAQSPRRKRPVKISVPVNLRKYYPTKTLRNFSQYLNPGIDPNYGDFTFEETLDQVHHYFRYMFTEKNLNARISKNVGDEKNIAMRIVPLFLKKMAIRLAYERTGECVFTSVISNVGVVNLPKEMQPHVQRIDILLTTARRNAVECAVVSYQGKLSITFTRSIAEPYTERMFFRMLVQQGLHVWIESNQS